MTIYFGKDNNGIYNFHDDRVSTIKKEYISITNDEWNNIQNCISKGGNLIEKDGRPVIIDSNNNAIDINSVKEDDFFGKTPSLVDLAVDEMSWVNQQAALATAMGETFNEDGKKYVNILRNIINGNDTKTKILPTRPNMLY